MNRPSDQRPADPWVRWTSAWQSDSHARMATMQESLMSRGSVHYSANILSSQLNTKHGFFLDCGTSLLKNMQMLSDDINFFLALAGALVVV